MALVVLATQSFHPRQSAVALVVSAVSWIPFLAALLGHRSFLARQVQTFYQLSCAVSVASARTEVGGVKVAQVFL